MLYKIQIYWRIWSIGLHTNTELEFFFLNISNILVNWADGPNKLGTIQVLRHQRGGWVGSENGNFL